MTSGLGTLLFLLCSFWIVNINVSLENYDGYNAAVTLLGGKFRMGSSSADTKRGELPTKTVGVKPFVIDKYPVTNENFRKFVRAKKFKTEAERFGWSFVFRTFVPEEVRSKITQSVPVGLSSLDISGFFFNICFKRYSWGPRGCFKRIPLRNGPR